MKLKKFKDQFLANFAMVNNDVSGFLNRHKKACAFALALGLFIGLSTGVKADLVSIDSTTGMPIFDASVVFEPLITALVAIVAAAAALWITLAGISFIKKFMHG